MQCVCKKKKFFQAEAALIHDGIDLFSKALKEYMTLGEPYSITRTSCEKFSMDLNEMSTSGQVILTKINEVFLWCLS